MIDLDRLEQRLDLALEAELRRHLGLEPDPEPEPEPRSRRRRRASAGHDAIANVSSVRVEPSFPAWPPPVSAEAPPPPPQASEQVAPEPVRSEVPPAWRGSAPTKPETDAVGSDAPLVVPPPAPGAPPALVSEDQSAPPLKLRTRRRAGSPLRNLGPRPSADAFRVTVASTDEGLERLARQIVDFVGQGRIYEADELIAAHAARAEELKDPVGRRDAAAWAVMRALLDGRHRDVRRQLDDVVSLGQAAGDPAAEDVAAWPRFWMLTEWGTEEELEDLLDFCRQRAYWNNELPWRAALTLLLARMGYADEATREFDVVIERTLNGQVRGSEWLDVMTNLAEAAATLKDAKRCQVAHGALGRSSNQIASVGRAWVCKGSTSRVLGLVAAVIGRPTESDRHFGTAMDKHRDMEALPLLARTCTEWGLSLRGRDNGEADEYLDEGFELADRLRMTVLTTTAQAGLDSLRQPVAS